jgi:hypothetical protein
MSQPADVMAQSHRRGRVVPAGRGGEMHRSRSRYPLAAALCAAAVLLMLSSAPAVGYSDNLLCASALEPKELEAYHDCAAGAGCYPLEMERALAGALRYLEYRVGNPQRSGERLAIVVDIDDTALSNYVFLKDSRFVYDRSRLKAWWQQERDPAIPGTLTLVKDALSRKVAVFLISGREAAFRKYTEANLEAAGYPVGAIKATGDIILKTPGDPMNPCGYKTLRRRGITEKGYTVILNVGDQYSDLEDCESHGRRVTGVVSCRGERVVKLPNPFYCIP